MVIPKLKLVGASLSTAKAVDILSSMSLRSFNRLLGHLSSTLRPRLWPAGAGCLTSYSFRRFGPSIANRAGLLLHERLPLGSWVAKGLPKHEALLAKEAAMPPLCADESRIP